MPSPGSRYSRRMRIIAGRAGSLRLKTPRSGTRPTTDRVREGVFSSLEARAALEGAAVLDLFAGSGALGLESLSRGAASLVLVDRAADAAAVCRANAATVLASLGLDRSAVRVLPQTADSFLSGDTGRYDLVFLDPPYDLSDDQLAATLDRLVARLNSGATVLVERSTRSPEPAWPAGLEPVRSRTYGETAIHLAEAVGQDDGAGS